MTVFLVLGFVGLALIVLSLVVGDHLDAVLDGALGWLEGDIFSTAVIGGFVSAFGFGAAASDGAGLPTAASVVIGAGVGVAVAWFAWWLTRLVKDSPSDGTVSISDAVGQVGKVLTAVPGGEGYGVVRVTVGGHVLQLNARCTTALEAGAQVNVTGVTSPTAVSVAPVWTPPTNA